MSCHGGARHAGKYWDQPLLYLHEQGHQSFLGHASAGEPHCLPPAAGGACFCWVGSAGAGRCGNGSLPYLHCCEQKRGALAW